VSQADRAKPSLAEDGRVWRYSAFISYSSRDRKWADWLHRTLERFSVPEKLRGQPSALGVLGRRLPAVFQDRKELASSADLGASIQAALRDSASLIVVCSPDAARSRWVNQEIAEFKQSGRSAQIRCLIISGEPHAGDPATECLPAALLADGPEPLAADARPSADGRQDAVLKIIAGLLGVGFDDLKQRELARRQRQLVLMAGASTGALILVSALAVTAVLSRNEAVRERDLAREKTLTAERTVDFVKSLFEVSDPSEARGAQVTALDVLDKGARRIGGSLNDEPAVKAELASTLSEVYQNLGFYRRGDEIVRSTMGLSVNSPAIRARQLAVLADSQSLQGNYDVAVKTFDQALPLARDPEHGDPELVSRILVGRGQAKAAIDNFKAAEADVDAALKLDHVAHGDRHPDIARDLEAMGLTKNFGGDLPEARRLYESALAIRIKAQGSDHPRVSEDYNELGSIAYLQHDPHAAETYWEKALASDERVLGPNHPDVAATLNNIARVKLERRAFSEARPLLERSVKITLAQRSETHDDLAFSLDNLAMADRGLGRFADAENAYRMALKAAMVHKHRNRGPILTDLAELLCSEGRFSEAASLVAQAEPLIGADYPHDPWRMAWLQNTKGYCLVRRGSRAQGLALLRASAPAVMARWPADTLYGHMAADRLRPALEPSDASAPSPAPN
jgi:tetratricopeptide (TPR) repeat protein